MAYRRLDSQRRPILEGSSRRPVTRRIHGEIYYLFDIRYDAPRGEGGQRRQRRVRAWLPDTHAAEALERELRGQPAAEKLCWIEACERWTDSYAAKRSEKYLETVARDVRSLVHYIGNLPIEDTPLVRYADWLRWREAQSSARTAQLARTHTLRIARWAASQGLVGRVPCEKAPVPEAPIKRRSAATPEAFFELFYALPLSARYLWAALGYTGTRFSAMAGLREADIGPTHLTVRTKRGQVVDYPLLPPILDAIEQARQWKAAEGICSDLVFVTARGTRWQHESFSNLLRRLYQRHPELPRLTAHQLRHMYATLAALAGYSADYLQAGLGHLRRTTAERYIHHTQAMRDAVTGTVAAALALHSADQPGSRAVAVSAAALQCQPVSLVQRASG